jgi:hypothetical protein
MWQLVAILIGGLLTVSAYSVYGQTADIEIGKNYDRQLLGRNADGTVNYLWTSHFDRIQDDNGNWVDYILRQDTGDIIFESAAQSFKFGKSSCSFNAFPGGKIGDGSPDFSMNHFLKEAVNGTNTWYMADANNLSCDSSVTDNNGKVQVVQKKGDYQVIYDIDPGLTEWTYKYTNNNPSKNNHKYGFTFQCNGAKCDDIIIDGQTMTDVILTKNQIQNKNINIGGRSFDTKNEVHDYFWALKKQDNKMIADFTDSKGSLSVGQTLTVDPTFGYSGTSYQFQSEMAASTGSTCSTTGLAITSYTGAGTHTGRSDTRVAPSGTSSTCYNAQYEWDISSITDGSTITDVSLKQEITSTNTVNPRNCDIRALTGTQPSSYTNTAANAKSLYDATNTGTAYITNSNYCTTAGIKTNDLGTTADSDLQNKLTANWFAVGYTYNDRSRDTNNHQTASFPDLNQLQVTYTATTVPDPPTSLSASAASATSASVSWTAPVNNGGAAITDYVIQYSSNNGSTWTTFADGTSTNTSTTVTGLTQNSSYVFHVAATNSLGTGSYSTNSGTVTLSTTAAPTSLSASAASATTASLSWTAPTAVSGAAITDYTIQYSSNGGSTWSTWTHTASTSTSATVTGLTQNSSYIFRVAAVNAVGTSAYSSNSGTVTLSVPNAPTGVTGSAASATTVQVSWTAPTAISGAAVTDYTIQYSSNNGSTWTTFADGTSTNTSTTVTGLTQNSSYVFHVAAVNAVGTGSYSSNSGTVTLSVPNTPTNVAGTSTINNRVDLTWTAPTAVSGAPLNDYTVQYSSNGGSTWTTWTHTASTSTSAAITGLTSNTGYIFRVAGVNIIGTGSYSTNSASVMVRPTVPAAPTSLAATASATTQIALSWTAGDDGGSTITDYVIQYSTDDATWTTFADGTSTATSTTVTGLTSNTLYYFRVAATNSIGTGSYTSSVSMPPLPYAPTALSITGRTSTTINISWTAPAGTATSDYTIQYSTDNTTWSTWTHTASTSTSATVTGLSGNTLYYLRVAAVNAGGTGAYSTAASGPTTPGAPTGFTTTMYSVRAVLSWTAPGGNQSITDYNVFYSLDNTNWTQFVDGTSTSTTATVTGLTQSTLYYFRVVAVNSVGGGASAATNASTLAINPVDTLRYTARDFTSVTLEWDLPQVNGATITGYQVNMTTPYGTPLTRITNSTNSLSAYYQIINLNDGTQYSFRVGVWTAERGLIVTGANILNVETLAMANYDIGQFELAADNPDSLQIRMTQEDTQNGKLLSVTYPSTYDLACDFGYKFAMQNQTYDNISGTSIGNNRKLATFTFNGTGTEVISAKCYDQNSTDYGQLTLTSSDFVLLSQIQNFRNGTYGTTGQFGALDLVTVIVVFISMIGFNRVNPAVGILFAVATMFGLAYFEIISPITSGVGIVIAVLFMLAVIGTRRED